MRKGIATLACAAIALAMASGGALAEWKPDRPINIIVPWGAGGSTDQMVRVVAGEIEAALGQKVIVVNQPGAAGAIGTKNALDAPRDGYTWTAGAAKDLGTYIVTDTLKTKIQDWNLYLTMAVVEIFSVNPKQPYKTMAEFIDGLKAEKGQLTVSTSGTHSSSFAAMEALAATAGIKYTNVSYDGGNPSVLACVAGEVAATPNPGPEAAEMIRAGKLRPLAAASDVPLEIQGYKAKIPPVTDTVPTFPVTSNYFGIWAPKGIPQEVVDTMNKIWAEKIGQSAALQKFASQKAVAVTPFTGEEAQKRVMPAVSTFAWQMWEGKKATVRPDTVGIPKP